MHSERFDMLRGDVPERVKTGAPIQWHSPQNLGASTIRSQDQSRISCAACVPSNNPQI